MANRQQADQGTLSRRARGLKLAYEMPLSKVLVMFRHFVCQKKPPVRPEMMLISGTKMAATTRIIPITNNQNINETAH